MKLDIGSGEFRYRDYTTVDLYDPAADHNCDAGELPFPDGSVTDIWASHILEHIPPPKVQPTLREWLRVLAPGGTAIIMCPDLDYACRAWLERKPAAQGMIFGMYEGQGQIHYLGWGALELADELRAAGFEVLSVQSIRETIVDNAGGTYWHDMVNLHATVRKSVVG